MQERNSPAADLSTMPASALALAPPPARSPRWRPAVQRGNATGEVRKEAIAGRLDGFDDEHRPIVLKERQYNALAAIGRYNHRRVCGECS